MCSKSLCGKNGKIKDFRPITEIPTTFSVLEFEFSLPDIPENLNVYKKQDVDISFAMVSKSGKVIKTSAFYFEEYEILEDKSLKAWGPDGRTNKAPCFRIRVKPTEEGVWTYTVTMKLEGVLVDMLSATIEVANSKKTSRLAIIEPKQKRVFATPDGKPFTLIGQNMGWNDPATNKVGFAQYIIEQMKSLHANGANYIRIWDFIDSGARIKAAPNVMRQDSSAMWDLIFESANELDFYIAFVYTPHCEATTGANARFVDSIWNVTRGGFIENPADFFSNKQCIEAFKNYVRYVISRFGCYESVLCWELFNEIDFTNGVTEGRVDEVLAWVKEITEYTHSEDPYGHLVSNSTAYPNMVPAFANYCDFIFYHQYNPLSNSQIGALLNTSHKSYNKPVVLGETGVEGSPKILNNKMSDDLLEFHQGCWSGLMGGGAGTGMHWWWERIYKFGGHKAYNALKLLSDKIPYDDENLEFISTERIAFNNNRLGAMGYCGANYAYIWFFDNNYLPLTREEEIEFVGETATFAINNGKYCVEFIDTRTGKTVQKNETTVVDENITIDFPNWSKDIAVAIEEK